jgi:hypothetical protein
MTAPFDQRSLEPLIQALLRRARHDADDVLAQADAEVAAVLQRAEAEADRILAAARERGAADGSASAAATRAGAQRRARSVLLDARRAAAEEERRAAREAVRTLMDDAEYPAVRAASSPGPGPSSELTRSLPTLLKGGSGQPRPVAASGTRSMTSPTSCSLGNPLLVRRPRHDGR